MPLPLEPARIYDGPMAVHFDGYSLDKTGRPTFRYSLDEGGKGAVLKVAESPAPIKASAATGFSPAVRRRSPRRLSRVAPGGPIDERPARDGNERRRCTSST